MTQNNHQLPPEADESYRAKLQEKHFGNFDKPLDFIRKESGMDIIRGVVAFRDLITVKDLKANCNTARLLVENNSYTIRYLEEPPTTVHASQEVVSTRPVNGGSTGSLAGSSAESYNGVSSEDFSKAIVTDVHGSPNADSTEGSLGGFPLSFSGDSFGELSGSTGGFSGGLPQSSNADPTGGFNEQFAGFNGPKVASTADFTGGSARNLISGSAGGLNADFNGGSAGDVDGSSNNPNDKCLNIVGQIINRIGQAITAFGQTFYAG